MFKSLGFSIFFALVFFFSCSREKEVIGSGKVITQSREVGDFSRISFSGMGDLLISQSNYPGLSIDAEDNIIDFLKTEVYDGTLHVNFKDANAFNIHNTKPIVIKASVTKLEGIRFSGSGSIATQNQLDINDLKLSISGSANVDLNVKGNKLTTILSGLGQITSRGSVNSQEIWLSGSGIYQGQDLTSETVTINLSGAGKVTIDAKRSLDVSISGAGTVWYLGDPKIHQVISGSGKLERFVK